MATERLQRRITSLLDEADDAIAKSDWELVRDRAKNVLALEPDNPDAQAMVAAADRAQASPTRNTPEPPGSASSPVEHPTSFADGRYQVKELLGEGGKKQVYLAQDTTLDREVAFALIKTEGLDDTSRSRIQREAQAMGRLGSHPHIVTVFDLGQEQDQPYMVTELMGGGDVEGLIEDAADHRLAVDQAINIAVETCRSLEFAHSRGVVHRDLKPGNVWLTENGTAKIGDFGLAVSLDRSRLTTEGMMVGTVAYMPPEQAMGGEVTPQSDLYSLGAMLYEMVTGRPPFLGDDAVAIIGQHINTPPVSPTWHNAQCPRPVEALVMRLLAKNPSERPESATDVLSALDAIDLATSVEIPAADADEVHALDGLAAGVFVGRQREMGELKACLEDALSGRGRMVTLVGEPGIGKTRTAQEMATYAGLRGAQVLWGRCYEEQGVPPYWPWVQAIRSYVRERDPEQLRSEMGAGAADIAEVVSDVRERLPDLQPAPQLEPEQARFRLFDSIAAFLKTSSQRQPLVLMLDDLHWADKPSLMLLEFVARELSNSRLLLIGTYRDVELSRQHPLAETLGELTRERLFQRVLLRGLTQEDLGHFIEMTSGNSAPRGLIEAVHSQTEGNPLFVTEVVRLLAQEGELNADPSTGSGRAGETDSWIIRIPEGVREVIGRRLNRLSQRCNEALTVASVIGREFTMAQLNPLVEEVTEDRLFELLEETLAARVIEELPQSVGRFQFTHALIQETLSQELSTTRKVRLHARIAEALEELYSDNIEAHAAELAHHFAEAQTVLGTEKLVKYSSLAGERALATYAYEEALAHIQRALAAKEVPLTGSQPAQDLQEADLLFGLFRAQFATLEFHELREGVVTLGRAFEYHAASGEIDRAVAVAEVPFIAPPGHRTGVAGLLARALALVPPDSHQAGRLLSRYSRALAMEEGDDQESRKAFDGAMAIARQEGDTALEMRTLAVGAEADMNSSRRHECLEKALKALEIARDTDDPVGEVTARFFAVLALREIGNPEEAERHASAVLDLAERLKDRTRVALALHGNETINSFQGNWDAARSYSDRGLVSGSLTPVFHGLRAHLEYEIGDSAQGDIHFGRFLEMIRGIPIGPSLLHAHTALAIPLVGRIIGRLDDADLARRVAEAVISSPYAPPARVGIARAGLALLETLEGHTSEVRKHYEDLKVWQGATLHFIALSGDRLLGILAQAMGETDKAVEHYEDALAFCRRANYRPELAWTCCDYADTLLEHNNEGDRAKAMSLLEESLAISSELGMRPLMERVLSRREILRA